MFPLQFGIPGGPELLVILLIAVLLFGANKIPKLARSTGEAMGEFQKGREEVEQELQEMRDGPTEADGSLETEEEPAVETATTDETTTDETTTDETEADEEEDADATVEDVGIEDAETDEETN
jgi:sec-independent protein translocase protein TatA